MHFRIGRAPLLDALELARRITTDDGSDMGITLIADGSNHVQMIVKSGRVAFRSPMECEVVRSGSLCLSARKMHERVKAIPSKSIIEVVCEKAFVRIGHYGQARTFGMLARPVVVELPAAKTAPLVFAEIDPERTIEWIKACSFASGDEAKDTRTGIGEIKILSREVEGRTESGLRLCMSDGYRVASDVLIADVPSEWPERVGVSADAIDLVRVALEKEKRAQLAISDSKIVLATSKGELEMRTAECSLPFDQLLSMAGRAYALRLPMTALETALVGLKLATDEGGGVEWHVADNAICRLVVRDKKGDVAAEEEVGGTWESDPCPMVAKLRGTFILEAVQAQRNELTEDVFLRFTHPLQPFVVDIGGDSICMFGPMRVEQVGATS